jgi:hypothetical protein
MKMLGGRTVRNLFLGVLLVIPLGCNLGSGPTEPDELGEGLRVLFIGNSLTYTNNLPAIVNTVAEAAGEQMAIRTVMAANFSLEDHWHAGTAVDVIQEYEWDVVVLQQGPSSLPENQLHLREWSGRFADEIRAVGGRPALYMVWPEEERLYAFDAVSDSYSAAAEAVGSILFPVGEAWRAGWEMDETLDFYGSDRFHPSELGSILAAFVIYQQLFDDSPVGLPAVLTPSTAGLPTITLDPDVATALQTAAAEANAEFGRR